MNLDKDDILLQHDRRIHVLEKQIQCLLDRSTLSHPTQYSNHHNHHHSQREESKHEIASPTQQPWSTKVFSLFGNDGNSITDDKSITTSVNDGKKTKQIYSIDTLRKLRPNNNNNFHQRHNIKIKQKFSHDKKLDKRPTTYDSKPPVLVPVIDNIKSVDIGGGLILESEGDENG